MRIVVAAQECESCSDLIRLLDQVRETFRVSHRLLNLIFGWDFEIRCLISPGSESVGEVQCLYPNVVECFGTAVDQSLLPFFFSFLSLVYPALFLSSPLL